MTELSKMTREQVQVGFEAITRSLADSPEQQALRQRFIDTQRKWNESQPPFTPDEANLFRLALETYKQSTTNVQQAAIIDSILRGA